MVLVFVYNDFTDNSSVLKGLLSKWDPDGMPWMSARRNADGSMRLLPPAPPQTWRVQAAPAKRTLLYLTRRVLKLASRRSYFATWLNVRLTYLGVLHSFDVTEELRQRPGYESLLGDWQPKPGQQVQIFKEEDQPLFFEDVLDFTAFGLDQFKDRADRDGVSLVILATHTMGTRGNAAFDRLHALATARGIPVIDQSGYIRRQGFKHKDARYRHDIHWNAAGHQWAAEALLEYLKQNPAICAQRPGETGR